jgi:alpha-galactosidase
MVTPDDLEAGLALAVDPWPPPGLPWRGPPVTALGPGPQRLGPGLEVTVSATSFGSGRRLDLAVRNAGPEVVRLGAVRIRLGVRARRLLEQGWQSWSPVEVRDVDDVRPRRRLAPHWARATWHAAPDLAGRAVSADQFALVHSEDDDTVVVGFLGGARHLATIVAAPGAPAGEPNLWAVAWLDGVELGPGEEWTLDPLWLAEGPAAERYAEFVDHWAAVAGARAGGPSPYGWCSWYQYFWKVRPQGVRDNLALAAAHGLELVQLDDGYQRAVGDWLDPAGAFAGPGQAGQAGGLAREIGDAGLEAGIWTAPFLATRRSRLMKDHPDWFVRGDRGRPLRAMWNPLSWKGWAFALDTTRPEVLDHLRTVFSALRALGFGYHKIDFCYAAAMAGRRAGDGRLTRAQALHAGLRAVREGIGEDATLLGCGCPFGPAVGVVDAMRVSPDTAPRWRAGLVRAPGYPDTAPAAANALRASVLRAPLHRRLWVNDPDCLLLRPTDTHLHAEQRRILAAVVEGTGGCTVVSDDLASYGPEQWAELSRLRAARPVVDRPLTLDPFADPLVVRGPGHALEVRLWPPSAEVHTTG